MISLNFLNHVYKTIIERLILSGKITDKDIKKSLDNFIYTHNENFPVLKPRYYERNERMVSAERINNNYSDIVADLSIIEDIIDDINTSNYHMEKTTELEISQLKRRISTLRLISSNINTNAANIISIIPDYIDSSNSTVKVIAGSNVVTTDEFIKIYKEAVTPVSLTYNVLSTYNSTDMYGSVFSVSADNPIEIIVSCKEYIPQKIQITAAFTTGVNGLYLKTLDGQSYIVESSLSADPMSLYNDLLITSQTELNSFVFTLKKNTPDETLNGYFIYRFYLTDVVAYMGKSGNVSRLVTRVINVNDPYILLKGDYTGNVSFYMSDNNTNNIPITLNDIHPLEEIIYINGDTAPDTSIDSMVGIIGNTSIGDYLKINGPYGCYEESGAYYVSTLDVSESGTIRFQYSSAFSGYILSSDGNIFYTFDSVTSEDIAFEIGKYKIYITYPAQLSNILNTVYELYVSHNYKFVAPRTDNDYSYFPKYAYTVINGTVYISLESMTGIAHNNPTEGLMSPSDAVRWLQIIRRTANRQTHSIILTIDLGENSTVSNLKLITTASNDIIGSL